MKSLAFGLAFLAASVTGFAQSTPGNEINPMMNRDYLNSVQQKTESIKVSKLQKQVASWDVRSLNKLERRDDMFMVVFKSEHSQIEANFDENGEIYSTFETYSNAVLPKKISRKILELYPDWKLVKSKQIVSYVQSKTPMICYKVKLTKGDESKTIRFNDEAKEL